MLSLDEVIITADLARRPGRSPETAMPWTVVAPTSAVAERSRRLFEGLGPVGVS
jgi:hypothetical protein